jgi:hypothetical protein
MRQYLQMNDMLWKLQWNCCQWKYIRTVHLHGCYQMQAVCYKFTMVVMGTDTMNAMYSCSVFLLLPMEIVCSGYVLSRCRHKLHIWTSIWGIVICDLMAHVPSITCKIWFWIRHNSVRICCYRTGPVGSQYVIIPCPVFVDVYFIQILNWVHDNMKLTSWAYN